jgi:hypothetical protein
MKSEGCGHRGSCVGFANLKDNAILGMFLEDTVLRFIY